MPSLLSRPRLVPSIDVAGCEAVKLVRGVPGTGLRLGDPRRLVLLWHSLGATVLHIVDLDGAARGRPSRCVLELVEWAKRETGATIQLGGGLRSIDALEEAHSAGADRLVVASAWLRRPEFLQEAVDALGPGVLVPAVEEHWDALPATSAWRSREPMTLAEAVKQAASTRGIWGLFYTQVFHEGEQRGVDLHRAARLARQAREAGAPRLAYSGGIAGPRDLELLAAMGYDEAVAGMALYTWRLNPLGIL
ncbi:HisA/HisF-related TIM barrel protein [Pyrodictium abyssi]|uniref:1-(5-phosphoribosyl)-5-[(5-phosphoribosylamino) me thylideneamino]imidazole-4-carboxamide isomerase n=1 Tax=Pyrodictium abyssi TaxID=54256 RepID=A0ABM8IW00_9CREN|nr:1-(5-phosphoribosyl)-5-[(5-phosphoribosylamino) me thylideneamino]imidazole-4-carboxamide isomerase [Pyrodictium abyssi]